MDAIQDLYLHYDWEVSPSFIRYLYSLDPLVARRLRKWAIAMVAWSISLSAPPSSDEVPSDWQEVLDEKPEFEREYMSHLDKMAGVRRSGGDDREVDVRVKNPQLRLPANRLKAEERYFGFRLCSFHSHRGTVGERACPHAKEGSHENEGWYDVVDLERKGERGAVMVPTGELSPPSSAKSEDINGGAREKKAPDQTDRQKQETKADGVQALSPEKGDMKMPPLVPKSSFQVDIRLDVERTPTGGVKTREMDIVEVAPLFLKRPIMEIESKADNKGPTQQWKPATTPAPNTLLPPIPKKKPSTVSMLIRDGFYLDVS
jgi:hypothetical protein